MKRAFVIAAMLVCTSLPVLAQRRGDPGPVNPFQGSPQAVQQGQDIYNENCSQCHGPNGSAGEIGPPIVSGERPDGRATDAQVFDTVKNGVAGTLMPAWSSKLSDDDIWKIASYIHALRGTAIDNPSPGDAAHGEQVFWDKGQCGSCHMINGRGGLIGPDLSNIASVRKTISIVDALTKVQHRVYGDGGAIPHSMLPMDTYRSVRVAMANGKTVSGVLRNEDNYSLQVLGTDGQLHLFDRAKVKVAYETSLMPTDYDKRLMPDEFKDLLAFLTRQDAKPAAAARGRGAAPPPSAN